MAAIAIERPLLAMSWASLLRMAAMGQVLALGVASVVLRDAEAAAVGVATLVGLFALRIRGGTIGAIILALLFADTGFFTGAAALTNLIDQADPLATIGPAAIAAVALPGLAAAAVAVWRRRRATTPSQLVLAVPIFAVAAFAAVSLSALVTGTEASAAAGALELDIKNVSFSTTQLDAAAGPVTVRVTNHDLFWHTFTVPELGVDLRVPVGGHKQITFSASRGTYTFLCSVPGHAAQMHGTLTVR